MARAELETTAESITVTRTIAIHGADAVVEPKYRDRPAVIDTAIVIYKTSRTGASYESVELKGRYLRKDGSVSNLQAKFRMFGDDMEQHPWVAELIEKYRPGLPC